MKTYNFKSPTRVDFAGGLLDIWPLYNLIENCFIVNLSIPLFTYAELKLQQNFNIQSFLTSSANRDVLNVKVLSPSVNYEKSFSNFNHLLKENALEIKLLKKHFLYWRKHIHNQHSENKFIQSEDTNINTQINIYLNSESPIGGGLGGSSSLCVNLAKMFCDIFKQPLTPQQLLMFCRDIETSVLGSPAGIQDYIPAMGSELNCIYIIEATPLGVKWKSQKIPIDFFKEHILLIDTKQSHHSGNNNWQIVKKAIEQDTFILEGLNKLRDNALKMVNICETKNWSDLFIYLKKEHKLREQFLFNWVTPEVSKVINLVVDNGADAIKLCGAGGGGCLLVLAKNKNKKQDIKNACQKNNIPIIRGY